MLTGLDVALAACGSAARFYAAADLAASPPSGASIQLSIPLMGVEVGSANDGPVDAAVVDPAVQFVPKPDELTAFPYSVGNSRVLPGAQNTQNFGVGFYNGFSSAVELDAVDVFQQGTAVSEEIAAVHAWADTDTNGLFDPAVDQLVASTTSSSSYYTLSGLALALAPKKITYLFVTYDLVLAVRDSVSVNMQVNGPSDFSFTTAGVSVQGEFPINSPGVDFTDGMIAAQIATTTAPEYRATPGEPNVYALAFTLPTNGFLQDVLRTVTIVNTGTAVPGQDITALNLWIEDSGDSGFDPMADRLAATLTWVGNGWRNPAPVSEVISGAGLRCYVSADVAVTAADNRTIQLSIPADGVAVASGNDGPIDAAITNAVAQTISTDPLLTTVSFDRATYSLGQAVTVTMNVRNAGLIPLTGVHPSAPALSGSGTLAGGAGPSPAVVDLAPGADTTLVWTYTAATAGTIDVCGNAFNADSTESSELTCAGGAVLQQKPFAISVSLDDVVPTGVNRGQENVSLAGLSIDYSGYDSLSAAVTLNGFALGVVDPAGSGIAPNSRLSEVTLVSSSGNSYTISVVDSASTPMQLRLVASTWAGARCW